MMKQYNWKCLYSTIVQRVRQLQSLSITGRPPKLIMHQNNEPEPTDIHEDPSLVLRRAQFCNRLSIFAEPDRIDSIITANLIQVFYVDQTFKGIFKKKNTSSPLKLPHNDILTTRDEAKGR